jgi:hypothetical protein
MSIQTLEDLEDEKITDFTHGMTDSLRKHNYALYKLLIESIPSGFYGFALQSTGAIMDAVRVR